MGKCNSKMGVETKPTVLIIGANGGIGTALLNFFDKQFKVIPTFFNNKPNIDFGRWRPFDTLRSDESLANIATQGPFDLIVDCSGAFFASFIQKTTPDEIVKTLNSNLIGPLLLARASIEKLAPRGQLVFMSSVVVGRSLAGSSAYVAAKAGLESGIRALGAEFSKNSKSIYAVRLDYMNYGMTFKLNESFLENIKKDRLGEEFEGIEKLGSLIIRQMALDSSNLSGNVYNLDGESL